MTKNMKKMTAVMAATMLMNPMTTFAEEIQTENAPETVNDTSVKSAEMEYVEKVETITQEIENIQGELNTLETESDNTNAQVVDIGSNLESAKEYQQGMESEVEEEATNRVEESKEAVENAATNVSNLEAEKENLEEVAEPSDTDVKELEKVQADKEADVEEASGTVAEIENTISDLDNTISNKEGITQSTSEIITISELNNVTNNYAEFSSEDDTLRRGMMGNIGLSVDEENEVFGCITTIEDYVIPVNKQVIAITDALEAENTYNNSYTTMLTSQAKLDAINNLLEAESRGEIELNDKEELLAEKAELEEAIPALTEKAAQDKAEYEEYKSKLAETFPEASEAIEAEETMINLIAKTGNEDLQNALDNFLNTYNEIRAFAEENSNLTEELTTYVASREAAAQASADIIRLNADKRIAEAKKAKAEELYNEAVAELEKAQEELTKAINKYNADTEAYNEYVKELERLNGEIETAKAELEKAQGDLSKAEGILANVKDGIFETVEGDPAYTKYNELVNNYLEKTLEVKELEKELANLKSEQESNTQKREELETKLAEAKAELEKAQQELSEYLASKEKVKPTQTTQTTKKPSVSGNVNTAACIGLAASSTMFVASSAGLMAVLKKRRDLNRF